MSNFTKPAQRGARGGNQNKSDMWLNLAIVAQILMPAVAAIPARPKSSTTPAVKAVDAVDAHYVDVLHTEDDPKGNFKAGDPVVINIQKGLGLSSDTKLGRSFEEAMIADPDREFKIIGTIHVVTAESEASTYEF